MSLPPPLSFADIDKTTLIPLQPWFRKFNPRLDRRLAPSYPNPTRIDWLRREDFLHSITTSTRPTPYSSTLPDADKIRLVTELISTNTLQGKFYYNTSRRPL
jgi:hypothetical protein